MKNKNEEFSFTYMLKESSFKMRSGRNRPNIGEAKR